MAAWGAVSPPRGQVRPSRDAPRPGRSGLQRVSGAEAAAVEFAARGWGPRLFACVHFSIVALECRRAVPDLDMSYNYVVTAQKPTAVNGCVTGEAARAGDPAREGAGGNRGLGRPAAGRDRVPGMEGAGGRRSSSQAATLKKLSSARSFWGAKAALEGPLSSWGVTWPRGQDGSTGTESEVLS